MSKDIFISRKDTIRGDREYIGGIGSTAKVHVFRTCMGYSALVPDTNHEITTFPRGKNAEKPKKKNRVINSRVNNIIFVII